LRKVHLPLEEPLVSSRAGNAINSNITLGDKAKSGVGGNYLKGRNLSVEALSRVKREGFTLSPYLSVSMSDLHLAKVVGHSFTLFVANPKVSFCELLRTQI
jgi:hypothetical protein